MNCLLLIFQKRRHKTKSEAALKWNSAYIYFFTSDDKVLDGYPASITNDSWPDLGDHATTISAALKRHSNYTWLFLKDKRYSRYDIDENEAMSGYPTNTAPNWHGVLD